MTTQNGQQLAKVEQSGIEKPQPQRTPLPFVPTNVDDAWRTADMLSKSGILPDALKGKAHDILVVLLTGAELGLSPMQAIREVYVVKGKGYISSLLKVSLVRQSGICLSWQLVESTDKVATFETQRRGDLKPTKMSFTVADAKAAGLLNAGESSNWSKYTALMLRRRCASQLADEVYPDVLRGTGAQEELEDEFVEVIGARIDGQAVYAPPSPIVTAPQTTQAEPVKTEAAPAVEKTVDPTAPDPVEVLLADLREADSMEALAELANRARTVLGDKHPRRAEAMALYAERKVAVSK